MRNQESEKGTTILELLSGLLLIAVITAILAVNLRQSLLNSLKTEAVSKSQYIESKTLEIMERVVADLDSHRFIIWPRIHKNGTITFQDGTLNPISTKTGSNSPSLNSDAITSMRPEIPFLQRVFSVEQQGEVFLIDACLQFRNNLAGHDFKSYIGINLESYVQLLKQDSSQTSKDQCRLFKFKKARSMSLPSMKDHQVKKVRWLVPLSRQYTLYVNKKAQLRYLSHRGESNIENQPLLEGLESLGIEESRLPDQLLMELTIIFQPQNLPSKSFHLLNRLARLEGYNLLMNL